MKKFALVSILSTLSLVAVAQNASTSDTVTISGTERTISLPSQYYKMWPVEFYEYKGAYSLSDGKSLTLFSRGQKMYAKVQDQDAHEIVAAASNVFVALDEKLKMRIDLHDDGSVGGELLMLVKRDVAGGNGSAEQLVAVAFR